MASITIDQAEELLLTLSREEQLNFLARVFTDPDFLEDLEDLIDLRLAKSKGETPIPWEQAKAELKEVSLF